MDDQHSRIDCKDERTLHMLYARLGRPALSKTCRLVPASAAEDIVQEVFIKAWEKKMVFSDLRSAFSWVYRCCTNGAIDFLRNKNSQMGELTEAFVAPGFSPEDQVVLKQSLKNLVEGFTDDEASVFIYRNVEGLSQDEVAEVMQISRRTVNRLQEKVELKLTKVKGGRRVG